MNITQRLMEIKQNLEILSGSSGLALKTFVGQDQDGVSYILRPKLMLDSILRNKATYGWERGPEGRPCVRWMASPRFKALKGGECLIRWQAGNAGFQGVWF